MFSLYFGEDKTLIWNIIVIIIIVNIATDGHFFSCFFP